MVDEIVVEPPEEHKTRPASMHAREGGLERLLGELRTKGYVYTAPARVQEVDGELIVTVSLNVGVESHNKEFLSLDFYVDVKEIKEKLPEPPPAEEI